MARAKRERPADPDRLVRRSAGDRHTEDGRFEVSSAGGAGRWYVTDTERHDGLGLALVLGPFGTLDDVRAAIAGQRTAPAGGDGPLPEPPMAATPVRDRQPEPEPAPEPAPPPPPPVRIERDRWRARHDQRDRVVEVVRRLDDAWLHGDADAMADDLHESVVMLMSGRPERRLEGRSAVVEHHRALTVEGRPVAWSEQDLVVDVVGTSAVVRYRSELEREADGNVQRDGGRVLWVLTRADDRWQAAWRSSLPEGLAEV